MSGDGESYLAPLVWLRTRNITHSENLAFEGRRAPQEPADWLEVIADGGQPDELPMGGFMGPQTVLDVIGEPASRLRFRTCWMAPEDYPDPPQDDVSFERYPYIEFPVAEVNVRQFAAIIREQATSYPDRMHHVRS